MFKDFTFNVYIIQIDKHRENLSREMKLFKEKKKKILELKKKEMMGLRD